MQIGWLPEAGGNGRNCLMHKEFNSELREMFWNETEVLTAQHYECTKCHGTTFFKMVNFISHTFHINKLFCLNHVSKENFMS